MRFPEAGHRTARAACVAGLVALGTLGAAEVSTSLSAAARLPAGDERLQRWAADWQQRMPALLAGLGDADEAVARGAAAVVVAANPPGQDVLDALAASPHPRAVRLASRSLHDDLDTLPASELLRLADPWVACDLLARHPADVLEDKAVAGQVEDWLRDPQAVAFAADLVVQRGQVDTWGAALVDALAEAAERDAMVPLRTLHQTLCVLTREQRSLAPYAGHHALLVRDWRDVLDSRRSRHALDPMTGSDELLALISAIPDANVVPQILAHGPTALPALEQAMAEAGRSRREELADVARLLQRQVTSALLDGLSAEDLRNMDAPHPRERRETLARAVAVVRDSSDHEGFAHLLTYLDDEDPTVRSATYDHLVRLSDDGDRFGPDWEMTPDGLFHPAVTIYRLRRSLQEGSSDERIAALGFIGTMRAQQMKSDVRALLVDDHELVVDSAIQTITRLHPDEQDGLALLRLAEDPSVAVNRRVSVLNLIAEDPSDYAGSELPPERLRALITDSGEAYLTQAAIAATVAVLGQGDRYDEAANLVSELLDDPEGPRQLAAQLLADSPGPVAFARLADLVGDADPQVAKQAVLGLLRHLSQHRDTIANELRAESFASLLERSDPAQPARWALAIRLGRQSVTAMLDRLDGWPRSEQMLVLEHALKSATATPAQLIPLSEALLSTQASAGPWPSGLGSQWLDAVFITAVLADQHRDRLLADGGKRLLGWGDSSYGQNRTVEEIALSDDRSLRLVGTQQPDQDDDAWMADDGYDWRVEDADFVPPTDTQSAVLTGHLAEISVDDNYEAYQDLALALLRDTPPAAEWADTWQRHDDLWVPLLHRHPDLRPHVVRAINDGDSKRIWYVQRFLDKGNPDLLPTALRVLQAAEDDWEIEQALPYLVSLERETLETRLLQRIGEDEHFATASGLHTLLRELEVVDVAIHLALLDIRPPTGVDARIEAEDSTAMVAALRTLDHHSVIDEVAALRTLQSAAPEVFSVVLPPVLAAATTRTQAAWLRTGLPLKAGLQDRYDAALASTDPHLWLVGAALALRTGDMEASDFLAQVDRIPEDSMRLVAAICKRYLTVAEMAGHDGQIATLIRRTPAGELSRWLHLIPPTAPLMAALRDRADQPSTARLIARAVMARLRPMSDAELVDWYAALPDLLPALPAAEQRQLEAWLQSNADRVDAAHQDQTPTQE